MPDRRFQVARLASTCGLAKRLLPPPRRTRCGQARSTEINLRRSELFAWPFLRFPCREIRRSRRPHYIQCTQHTPRLGGGRRHGLLGVCRGLPWGVLTLVAEGLLARLYLAGAPSPRGIRKDFAKTSFSRYKSLVLMKLESSWRRFRRTWSGAASACPLRPIWIDQKFPAIRRWALKTRQKRSYT